MPKKDGHVLSMMSSWENRFENNSNTLSSNRKSTNEANQRPSYSRSKTVKTMNTRNTFLNAYDQENGGDRGNRKAGSSANNNTNSFQGHAREEKSQERASAKKGKGNAWVKQTDTDETTSISSHSNEISIGKTLSNISDVSAHSSTSSWRYKSASNRGKVDSKQWHGLESYKSYSSSRPKGLSSKQVNESHGLHKKNSSEDSSSLSYSLGKISSEDETSKLNYSLEKLTEDGEDEMYLKTTSVSYDAGNFGKTVLSTEGKLPVTQESRETDSTGSSNDNGECFEAYSNLSNRFNDKILTVSSTDSSLVYSMGNNEEDLKKFTYSYSCDQSEDLTANDLIASTLAECRLLLQMSPPPTPLGGAKKSSAPLKDPAVESSVVQMEYTIESPVAAQDGAQTIESSLLVPENITTPRSIAPSVTSSPANSSTGLGNFLKCPCCHKMFTNDIVSDENRDRQPLHSCACDHIVCHECVFASPSSRMVACPQCGEENAFDKTRPVISRSYCTLVKSIEILKSGKKGDADELRPSSGNKKNSKQDKSNCMDGNVPQQIRFSPKKDKSVKRAVLKEEENSLHSKSYEKQDVEQKRKDNDISLPTKSEPSLSTPLYPEEPATPVSRAEFRFMQRKEKLAQSLEKVNRLLERSRMTRNEFELKTIEEGMNEKKDVDGDAVQETKEDDKATESQYAVLETKEDDKAAQCRFDDEVEVLDCDETEATPMSLDNQAMQKALNESVRVDGDIVDSKGFEIPQINTLWADEIPSSKVKEQSAQKRIKPELRVDTGNYTPIARQKQVYLEMKDAPVSSSPVDENKSGSDAAKRGSCAMGSSVNDIFRDLGCSNPTQEINFGSFGNRVSSEDSSLTDKFSDNRFLLGNSVAGKSDLFIKEKKYGLYRPSPMKDVKMMSAEKHKADEHRCPQFLPSLTYSTMRDSNELVGLMQKNDGKSWRLGGSRKFNNSHFTPSKMMMRSSRGAKGMRMSFGKAESFDESSLVQNQNRPYEFTQHSCSFSPASHQSLNGALVTHKPKLHKRIISKFRIRKNPKLYCRK